MADKKEESVESGCSEKLCDEKFKAVNANSDNIKDLYKKYNQIIMLIVITLASIIGAIIKGWL